MINNPSGRKLKLGSVIISISLLFAGCAVTSDSENLPISVISGACVGDDYQASPATKELSVGYYRTFGGPVLEWAKNEGCMAENGLNVDGVEVDSTTSLASLVSGKLDITGASVTELIIASANSGFEFVVIASMTGYSKSDLDRAKQDPLYPGELLLQVGLVASPESGIKTWADLAGKTLATGSLSEVTVFGTNAAARMSGVNADDIKYVSIPNETRLGALQRGDVDAIISGNTVVIEALQDGNTLVGYPGAYYYGEGPVVVWVTTPERYEEKREAIDSFRKSVIEAQGYLADTEAYGDSYRKVLVDSFAVEPGVAVASPIPDHWTGDLSVEGFKFLTDTLLREGVIASEPKFPRLLR